MAKINPFNVAKLLIEDISSKYTKSTSINAKEIELKDHILGNIVKTNISATYISYLINHLIFFIFFFREQFLMKYK
jgi:hypothetical protein